MTRNLSILLVGSLFVLGAAVFGCGDTEVGIDRINDETENDNTENNQNNDNNDPNGTSDNPEDSPYYEEAVRLSGAQCDQLLTCCSNDEFAQMGLEDEEECESWALGVFGLVGDPYESSYAEGAIGINDAAVDDCEQSLAELSCDQFDGTVDQLRRLDGCADLIEPQLDGGEVCNASFECTTGACAPEGDGDAICQDLPSAGGSCDGACSEGLYCDDGECSEQKDAGEECNVDDECLTGICEGDDPDEPVVTDAYCQEAQAQCEG